MLFIYATGLSFFSFVNNITDIVCSSLTGVTHHLLLKERKLIEMVWISAMKTN